MVLTLVFFVCLSLAQMGDAPRTLFAEERWYKDAAGTPQTFEGVLDWTRGTGRIGLPKRFYAFHLEMRENDKPVARPIFANGKDSVLAPFGGHRVRLTAKAVERDTDGDKVTELWPEKLDDLGPAPASASFAVPIVATADTWNWLPSNWQQTKRDPVVLNDAKQAAQFLDKPAGGKGETDANEALGSALKEKIDWSRHTVVFLPGGAVHYDGARIEVDRISAQESGLLISWKVKPIGKSSSGTTSPVLTILLPKQAGKITFQQEGK